ncbi:MAG: hypothetical protein V1746_00715 [bacterium]
MKSNITPQKRAFLIRSSPAIHFEECVRILDKENNLISPKCNALQREMSRVYETCMKRRMPCRMLVLKPRQVGCSTFAAQILYHHCRNRRARAVQIADDLGNADNIFRIFCRHAEHDSFPWKSRFSATRTQGVFSNGSLVEKDTAQNPRAGISATRQCIHASEVAKWAVSGVRAAHDVMGAMLNSLADVPQSVAIAESTPHGAAGWFYEQWRGAVTLEESLENKRGNGWIKVLMPWFKFDSHQLPASAETLQSLDEHESRGRRLYGWTAEQIAWRRFTRDNKCGGSDRLFDEYYPEDDVCCFLTSGAPRFDVEWVGYLADSAAKYKPEQGCLREEGERVVFEASPENEAWVQIWEYPETCRRYLIAADLSVGENQSASEESNPDRHSVLVLCEGYWTNGGNEEHPYMLVARIKPPTRVGFDVLAWQTDLLSRMYGRCVVAPEMNNSGMAFIERLKERRVPLYMRRKANAQGGVSKLEGWQTTGQSRKLIIDELASLIFRGSLSVRCPHAVGELRTFVTNAHGREEALPGCHDDDVLALAIGLHCLPKGTFYALRKMPRQEPRDGYEKREEPRTFEGKW